MDVAQYINTLDQLDLKQGHPANARFAIVDLATDPGFMKSLYEAMNRGTILWKSLLEQTRWQSAWQSGPILVDVLDHPRLQEMIAGKCEATPLGVLLDTGEDFDTAFQWCKSRLLGMAKSDESLFRFYEARSLTALLAALGDKRRQLLLPGMGICWHDGSRWLSWQAANTEETVAPMEDWTLSQAELSDVANYRLADRAIRYAQAYREHINTDTDPRSWTMGQLLEARQQGFKSVAQQEHWLRLTILNDGPLTDVPAIREIMEQTDLTTADRLTAMESFLESEYATA